MAIIALTSKMTLNPNKPGISGTHVSVFALHFIKEGLSNGKVFRGGSDTTEKMRDMFTRVLCECKRQGGQQHVTKTLVFKNPGRAVIQKEGEKLVSSFRGNHKAC